MCVCVCVRACVCVCVVCACVCVCVITHARTRTHTHAARRANTFFLDSVEEVDIVFVTRPGFRKLFEVGREDYKKELHCKIGAQDDQYHEVDDVPEAVRVLQLIAQVGPPWEERK